MLFLYIQLKRIRTHTHTHVRRNCLTRLTSEGNFKCDLRHSRIISLFHYAPIDWARSFAYTGV